MKSPLAIVANEQVVVKHVTENSTNGDLNGIGKDARIIE
jgi:hypothetical protein